MGSAKETRKILAENAPALLRRACKLALGDLTLEDYAREGHVPADNQILLALIRQLPKLELADDPVNLGPVKRSAEERVEEVLEKVLTGEISPPVGRALVETITAALDASEAARLLRLFHQAQQPRGFM